MSNTVEVGLNCAGWWDLPRALTRRLSRQQLAVTARDWCALAFSTGIRNQRLGQAPSGHQTSQPSITDRAEMRGERSPATARSLSASCVAQLQIWVLFRPTSAPPPPPRAQGFLSCPVTSSRPQGGLGFFFFFFFSKDPPNVPQNEQNCSGGLGLTW